jgi:hypothetical protein
MKNSMSNSIREAAKNFESLVEDIFVAYEIELISRDYPIYSPKNSILKYIDFTVKTTEVFAAVEVKMYFSFFQSEMVWRRNIEIIRKITESGNFTRGLLVTNARCPPEIKSRLPHNITIWDYDSVSFLAGKSRILSEKWTQICSESFRNRHEPLPNAEKDENLEKDKLVSEKLANEYLIEEKAGKFYESRLPVSCADLKEIKTGAEDSKKFEKFCTSAIQFLFGEDIVNLKPQTRSSNSLHVYDLIGRISSSNEFWTNLVFDFHCRYVIFEFKNYSKKITQKEIYSTEKYLFPKALRTAAIIISRNGADDNAQRVIEGALRSDGKLIVSISTIQLCEMLRLKENGDDPTLVLMEVIENIMMRVER